MEIIKLFPGDLIETKKSHPCGENRFRILRVGSMCRIVCLRCGRDMEMDRIKLEKAIKKVISESNISQ